MRAPGPDPTGDPDPLDGESAATFVETGARPRDICERCVALLDVTGAGLTMITADGQRALVHATDGVAALVESAQVTVGQGPGIDALQTGGPVLVDDLEAPGDVAVDRWTGFLDGMAGSGLRAVFAFPLRIGAISLGTLCLYRDRPGPLTGAQVRAGLLAADAAALALLHLTVDAEGSPSDEDAAELPTHLQVHQATGMVQVQLGIRTDQALLVLRARAFALGRPLEDVADDVVQRRLRFTMED